MYTERQILESKTPEECMERCIDSDLPWGKKMTLFRQWMEMHDLKTDDIKS